MYTRTKKKEKSKGKQIIRCQKSVQKTQRGKQHENSGGETGKENKKTEQTTQHSEIIAPSQKQERSRRKRQQTVMKIRDGILVMHVRTIRDETGL